MPLPDLKRKQKSGSKDEYWGIALLCGVGLAVVLLLYVYFSRPPTAIKGEDNCPEQVASHTVMLLDLSDPLTASQARRLQDIVEAVSNELAVDERISIYLLDSGTYRGLSDAIVSLCRPKSGKEANEWVENKVFIQRRYEEKFKQIFDQKTGTIAGYEGAKTSPILEALFDLSATPQFQPDTNHRRLVLVSDLVQNSARLTMIRPDWRHHAADASVRDIVPYFGTSKLELYVLMRDRPPMQAVQVEGAFLPFWLDMFGRMGMTVQFIEKVR